MIVKLSQKGWVVIPASLREKYGLKPGANLQVVDYGGVLAIVPASKDHRNEGTGMLMGDDSLTRVVVEEHKRTLKRGR